MAISKCWTGYHWVDPIASFSEVTHYWNGKNSASRPAPAAHLTLNRNLFFEARESQHSRDSPSRAILTIQELALIDSTPNHPKGASGVHSKALQSSVSPSHIVGIACRLFLTNQCRFTPSNMLQLQQSMTVQIVDTIIRK